MLRPLPRDFTPRRDTFGDPMPPVRDAFTPAAWMNAFGGDVA